MEYYGRTAVIIRVLYFCYSDNKILFPSKKHKKNNHIGDGVQEKSSHKLHLSSNDGLRPYVLPARVVKRQC